MYLKPNDVNGNMDNLVSFIREIVNSFTGILLVGGDFNSRIGESNQVDEEIVEGSYFNSTRKTINLVQKKQGRLLVAEMEDLGLIVLNGRSISDPDGSPTFVDNKGSSTIDLI